jgi:hypothetical protein
MVAVRTRPADQRAEISRHALWPLTPKNVRAAILLMAGFSRDRVGEGLDTFTSDERRRIWAAADTLARDAGVIAQCAQPAALVAH